MKIKNSFITNSSSSCYVGFGIVIEQHEAINIMREAAKCREIEIDNFDEDDLCYDLSEILIKSPLSFSMFDCYIIIGGQYLEMPMYITPAEYHQLISEELIKLGFNQTPGIVEEAWYDG